MLKGWRTWAGTAAFGFFFWAVMTGACGQKALYGEPGRIAHTLMLQTLPHAYKLSQDAVVSNMPFQPMPSKVLSDHSNTLPACSARLLVNTSW